MPQKRLWIHVSLALLINALLLALVAPTPASAAVVLYAKPAGLTSGTCSTWATACTLTYALGQASTGSEIWAMAGTYTPGTARTSTFALKSGVKLYGGFTGSETALSSRDWVANETILSGEIGSTTVTTDNVYHVVSGSALTSTAVLDGFTISGGMANGSTDKAIGAGIYLMSSSPQLAHLKITSNQASSTGGGIYSINGTPVLSNISVVGNVAAYAGGMFNSSTGSAKLYNMIFNGNSSTASDTTRGGGGLLLEGSGVTDVVNTVFVNNTAVKVGGALFNHGSSPRMVNVSFGGNSAATSGGAVYTDGGTLSFRNSIFWGNTAASGAQIYRGGGTLTFFYSIIQDGCPTGATCTNLIAGNPSPQFVNLAGGDLRLKASSPAINAGDNAALLTDAADLDGDLNTSETVPYDLAGSARRLHHPSTTTGGGTAPFVDLGAYETENTAPTLDNSKTFKLTPIPKNPSSNSGTLISTLLASGAGGDPISDPDAGAQDGIAITSVQNSNGTWQYSLDGTTWVNVEPISSGSGRLLASDATTRLRFVPNTNYSGTASLIFSAWDLSSGSNGGMAAIVFPGGHTSFSTAQGSASIIVSTPPTISDIANQITNENTVLESVSFTIGDAETAANELILTATSSNIPLVSPGGVHFSSSGTNRTFQIMPTTNQYGTATITVTVSDGLQTASDSFVLTVNDTPTISDITNQVINKNTTSAPISFTVGDGDTAATALTITATSTDTELLPNANIVLGGSGANRTLTLTPALDRIGRTRITVTVSDGRVTSSDQFLLTVNSPPTLSDIANQTISKGTATAAIPFTIGDVETAASSLTVTITSSNTTLLPSSGIVLGGSGTSRTLTLTPSASQTGTSTVTVTVSDGVATVSDSFVLTVNNPPTISNVADQTTRRNIYTPAIPFTVGDAETAAAALVVTATSSNTTLLPDDRISFGGSGANRTVVLMPAEDQVGTATVTITVSDGAASASDSLVLTVTQVPVRYVTPTGLDSGACDSWANACTLNYALSVAVAKDQIWVKAGSYKPGSSAASSFVLKSGVELYGGFAGTETSISQRNWVTNVTTLNGGGSPQNYHVVKATSVSGAVLDGFTITGGKASVITNPENYYFLGGGLYLYGSSLSLSNLIITGNSAIWGGGLYTEGGGTVTLTNSLVRGNNASIPGYNGRGGGMSVSGSTTVNLNNVTVANNTASSSVGGIDVSYATLNIRSSIVWGNTAPTGAAGIEGSAGSTVNVSYSITQEAASGTGNLNVDPQFVNAGGGDFRLKPGSLAVDAGNNSVLPVDTNDMDRDGNATELLPYDLNRNARQTDYPRVDAGSGSAPIVDMGAYEMTANTAPTLTTTVSPTLTAINEDVSGDTGTPIATLLSRGAGGDPISDPDLAAQDGIAIVTADVTNGAWQYSLDSGTTWNAVGSPSASTARLLASDAVTRLRFVPNANYFGTATITFVAWDQSIGVNGGTASAATAGGSSSFSTASLTASITVNPVNDAPTISNVGDDQLIPMNAAYGPLSFTVGDVETAVGSLTLSATSSNQTVLPNASIVFGGSGANRSVTLTPAAGQRGITTVTITVNDGSGASTATASDSFVLKIDDAAPTISTIANQTINENAATAAIPFTIGPAAKVSALTLSAASSNTTLLPDANIALGGSGASRTVKLTPVAGSYGSATVTINVTDGVLTTSTSFTLTVNDIPTIANIGDQLVPVNTTSAAIAFTIGDSDTAVSSLTLSRTSSNTTLLPEANIVFGGSGANRTVTLTPVANQYGSATVTITVSDGSASSSDSFVVTIDTTRHHASPTGLAGGSCESWANACTLTYALSLASSGDEIWVKAGTYVPGTSRSDTFNLKNGVAVYGGFAGSETARSQRNWKNNATILSGEIGGASTSDNIVHVVKAVSVGNTTVLDGFTITKGTATGSVTADMQGAGLYSDSSSPILANLTFSSNDAGYGGAIYLRNSHPLILNTIFSANRATVHGGAMYLTFSNPTLAQVVFSGNFTVMNDVGSGAALYNNASSPVLTNTTFYNNSSRFGVIANYFNSSPQVRNSILWGNSASPFYLSSGTPVVTYSIVQNGIAGAGNLDQDPMFADVAAGDLRLSATSPAIDSGNNSVIPADSRDLDGDGNTSELLPYDLKGVARFVDHSRADTGNGSAPIVDMGAYEAQANTAPTLNTAGSPTLNAVDEDTGDNPGTLISAILSSSAGVNTITDPDPGAAEGIAITAAVSTNGTWEYSLDGSTWNALGAPTTGEARLLAADAATRLRFVPKANYNGSASFTFLAWDLSGGSNGATINATTTGGTTSLSTASETAVITVTPTNDAPVNTKAPGTLPDGAYKHRFTATSGTWNDALDGGTSTITYTYQWQRADDASGTNPVNVGEGATYTAQLADLNKYIRVNVVASDNGVGLPATASSAAVGSVYRLIANTAPDANPDSFSVLEESTGNNLSVLSNDTDADGDTPVLTGVQAPAHGTAVISGTSIQYTPETHYDGEDSFTYTISDGMNATATGTVHITVTAINHAPVAVADTYSASEDTPLTVNAPGVLDNDTDLDGNTLTALKVVRPAHGILMLNDNGSFTYTPEANWSGEDSFSYKVNDGSLDSNAATVTITVGAVNDAPAISSIPNQTVLLGSPTADVSVPFTVSDPETAAGTLTLSAVSSNTAVLPDTNISFGGSGADRTLILDPLDVLGTTTVTVTVKDAELAATSVSFTLMVADQNPPTLSAIADQTTLEDTVKEVTFTIGDVETAVDALSLSVTSTNPALVPPANVVFSGTGANRTATITPLANRSGQTTLTITVTDGGTLTASESFVLTVESVNDAPLLASIGDQTAGTGELLRFTVSASDVNGDSLIYSLDAGAPDGAAIDPDSGVFTWRPDSDGTVTVTIRVSDGHTTNAEDFETITIKVVNRPHQIFIPLHLR